MKNISRGGVKMNNKITTIIFLILLSFAIIGCENVDVSKISDQDLARISDNVIVCNQPYIRYASGCCLDKDNNNICDRDERDLTPTEKIEEEQTNNPTQEDPIISQEPADVNLHIYRNSEDWQNVYSRALYKVLLNITPFDFKNENDNLYYAEKIDINQFIIINTKDTFDAVSVAPYAALTKSYVLFADEKSIGSIMQFLNSRNVRSLILYGNLDDEVKQKLDKFNPDIISKGGKFENNIEIVKKYQEIKNAKQVILTNGEFLEAEIMSGVEPVIFIGADNVPTITQNYIKNSNIELGVLIGNELAGTGTFVRRQTGISVFVKFASGASGDTKKVEGLDTYYFSKSDATNKASDNFKIIETSYDKDTKEFVITFKNYGETTIYAKGTYTLSDQESDQTIGDVNAFEILAKQEKTQRYTISPLYFDEIRMQAFITYGSSKYSMEYTISKDEYI
ncbi:MAG: hypothetical protein ABIF10_04105 [Candidatus Woesearchaeota archaeon]